MIKIITQELEIESNLKQRLEFICEFCHIKSTIYFIYHLNMVLKKLPEFIQNIVERLFNYSDLDLKYFKQQYDPEVKSRLKGFNIFNKKEIEKATKHINNEMDEYAEKFYEDKKDKGKDDGFEL